MTFPSPTNEEPGPEPRETMILVESDQQWVLTHKFDPRLEVGCIFTYLGTLWTVTWESDDGFGPSATH